MVFLLLSSVQHPVVFIITEVIILFIVLGKLGQGLHTALVEPAISVGQLALDPFSLLHPSVECIVLSSEFLEILLWVLLAELLHLSLLLKLQLLFLATLLQRSLLVYLELLQPLLLRW